MIEVIPGVGPLSDFEEIKNRVALAAPHTQWIQIDFSDGSYVENTTFMEISKFSELTKNYPKISFEAHLMVMKPEKYLKALCDAGFKRVIAHVECLDIRLFLDEIQYESIEAGIAIDGATELENVEPYLDQIDMILIMTVEAGESGRPFLPETVDKIRTIHEGYPDLSIEVDGAMNEQTSHVVRDAGATRIVATSYLFKDSRRIADAIRSLKE